MKQLSYIRLLYLQAVSQSHAPPPLNFSTVLTFHDVMEWFFIAAVAHLGNPQGLNLKASFAENVKKMRAPDGNALSSIDVVQRVGHDRNGLKHNGSIPGPDQVEQVRRDVTMFLEGNCPRLFGIEFSTISMLHVVPQEPVRVHLNAGRTHADAGDMNPAMAEVALAFDRLILDWGHGKYLPHSSTVAGTLHLDGNRYGASREIETSPSSSDRGVRDAISRLASSVKRAFADTDKEIETLRRVLRLQIAGIDMASYTRFAMITPAISTTMGGGRHTVDGVGHLHYTPENYDFCEMFVVDSALRIGQRDFTLWMPETYGDYDRAIAAMNANNGRLPDIM